MDTQKGRALKLLRDILVLNIAAGTIACLAHVSFYHTTRSEILGSLLQSLAISFCIGTPICLLMALFGDSFARRQFPGNWALLGICAVGCAIAGNLAYNVVSITFGWLAAGEFWSSFWTRIQLSVILALSITFAIFGYRVLRHELETTTLELRNKQLEEERARKLALEAQLASLESHVRPHFLFNTLNTISSLIPEDPKLAESLVGKLATLLRLSLDSNQERLGSLERELKIVTDYLEIEHARYGERLRFRIDVPPELRSAEVPALSLQTLVENSVKYAVGSRVQGAEIRVAAFAKDGSIFVEVSDDGPGFTAEAIRPGHGLDNLQRRLANLFGPAARLEISSEPGCAAVTFCLPRIAAKIQ